MKVSRVDKVPHYIKKMLAWMQKSTVWLLLCVAFPSVLYASSPQESLNQVYEAAGTATEIAKRAQVCMARHLHNDSVQLNDSSTQSILPRSGLKPAAQSDGGQVLTLADVEGGVLIATHRVPFSSWGMAQVAQSVLTVNTKDGRFKMETTDIMAAQLNTGAIANNGFVEYREKSGGFKAAVKAIGVVQQKLVACIQDTSGDDW